MGQKMLLCVCLVVTVFVQAAEVATAKAVVEPTTETNTTTNFTAGNTTKPVPILRQINHVNPDGSYTYGFEGGDGSFKIETRDIQGNVHGKYGYVDEFGEVKTFEYGSKNDHSKVPKKEPVTTSQLPVVSKPTPEPKLKIQSEKSNLKAVNSNKNHRQELVSAISKLLNIPNPQVVVTVKPEPTSTSKPVTSPKSEIAHKITGPSEVLDFHTIKSRPLPQFMPKPNPKPTTTARPIPQSLPASTFQPQTNINSSPHSLTSSQHQTNTQVLHQGQFPFQSQHHPHPQFQSQTPFQSHHQLSHPHRFQSPHFQSQFQPHPQFNSHHTFQHHPQSHNQHQFKTHPHFQSQISHFPQAQLVAQPSSVSQTNVAPNSKSVQDTEPSSTSFGVKDDSSKSSPADESVTPSGTSVLAKTSPHPQLSPQQLAQILKQLLQ